MKKEINGDTVEVLDENFKGTVVKLINNEAFGVNYRWF